jgi:hypothetical protein
VRAPAHGALARQPSARSLPPAPSLWCGLTRGRSLTAPAYRFFNKKRFPELKIEHPDWKFGDFSRAVSAEWKQLDDATKAPYELEAATDKTRYEQQMLTYVPPRDDGTPETKRKKKDPNAPKRNQPCACAWLMARWLASRQPALSLPLPLSGAACGLTRGRSLTAPAYGFFNMKRRAELKIEHPDWKFGDLSRAVSAEWKQMDEAAKAPYELEAATDKTRYEQQMLTYVPPHDDGAPETKRKKKDPNAPKRNQPCACAWLMARWLASRQPALSLPLPLSGAACGLTRGRSLTAPAYGFFNMKRRAELKIENPDWKFGDLSRAVSAEWKQLDEAAKAPWQAQANEDKTRYEQQMASYSSSSPSPSSSPSDISAN